MKWQYKILVCANNYELDIALNKHGKKGWEAYGVERIQYKYGETYIAYLKRPKP